MSTERWQPIVALVAPRLGAAAKGPLRGTARRLVSTAILGKPYASDEVLAITLTRASPDQLAILKQVDADFAASLAELKVDTKRLQDRNWLPQPGFSWVFFSQIAVMVLFIVAFFALLYTMVTKLFSPDVPEIDSTVLALVNIALGVILAEIPRQMSWLYRREQDDRATRQRRPSARNSEPAEAEPDDDDMAE